MALFRRVFMLGRRSRMEREIESELREHMQMCIDDNVAAGMSREEAVREARLRFGNPSAMHERVSAEDAALGLENLWHDVRFAMRGFSKSPGFALVAIATLALGIGANTAIFELLDAVRLRSLPVQKPGELAELQVVGGNRGFGISDGMFAHFTIPMWQEIRRYHDPFTGVFAWRMSDVILGKPSDARRVQGLEVSGEFFNVLGVAPLQGRLIEPQDESSCNLSKVVVSYAFWNAEMNRAAITPTTTIVLEGRSIQVLGVTPPSFFGMVVGNRFDVAYPTCTPRNIRKEIFTYSVMGRLKPGWNINRASAWLGALSPGLFESTAPDGYSAQSIATFKAFRLAAYPAGAGVSFLRAAYNRSLELLLAITGLVLLIACANLANLMLARASVRQREIAIRMALGASRLRLFRQMLIESGLLALIGASLGVAIAQPLARLLVTGLNTSQNAIQLTIAADYRVLLFAALVAALTCVLFGTLPAVRSAGADPISSIKSGERGVVGNRERFSVQRFMVVAQMSVSMVLLVAALLFVRSYRNLITVDPGMRESTITIGFLGFPSANIKQENMAAYKRQIVGDIRAVPGIDDAAGTTHVPLSGGSWSHTVRIGSSDGSCKFTYASPSYFSTMGIPLVTGRAITAADTTDAPLVLVVNQAFVRKYFSGASPIGQDVHVLPEPQYPERTYRIVGTVADSKYFDLREDAPPIAYVPIDQFPVTAQRPGLAVVFASRDKAASVDAFHRMLQAKYPGMVMQFFDFQQGIRDNLVGDRLLALLSGFFGVLAALLVVVGLYGVLSYFLAQRRSEIGIRIALGATRARVVAQVVRDAVAMLLIGLVVGTALALAAGREAGTMLFGLKSWDPGSLVIAAALLIAVTLVTSLIPAIKAARLDPVSSLRTE